MTSVLIVPTTYLTLTYIFYFFRNILQKYKYDTLKNKYNCLMIFISVINFITTIYIHFSEKKYSNQYDIICKPYNVTYISRLNATIFLCSKIFEWMDTFFLIVNKKKISILHMFHHGSTFVLCYINIYPSINSLFGVCVLTNSFVHIFMYAYYNGYFKPFRKYITQMQILQHVIVLYSLLNSHLFIRNGYYCNSRLFDIRVTFFCYFIYLLLFANFYIQNSYIKVKNVNE